MRKYILGLLFASTLFLMSPLNANLPVTASESASEIRTNLVLNATNNCTDKELQALLDYNINGYYNLTIKIPAGTYELSQELRIYSNTTIQADTNAKFIRTHEKGAILANDLSNDRGGYTTTQNITIDGGIWDSSRIVGKDTGSESIRIIHASNVTIQNAVIRNVPDGSHLITLAGVKNAIVKDCTLYGYTGVKEKEAIHLDIVHNEAMVPSMQVSTLTYDDLACDGITITGCEIYNYPRAIGSHSSVQGVFHKNVVIEGNDIHDIYESAIRAYNYTNLEINENNIYSCGLGILVYTSLANEEYHYFDTLPSTTMEALPDNYKIRITGNTIRSMTEVITDFGIRWGDGIRIIGSNTRPLTGVTMKNNIITSTDRYGIFVEGAPGCYVGSNTITNTYNHAIYLINGCTGSKVNYNKITGKPKNIGGGIGVTNSKKVGIYKNTVSKVAKSGIFLYTGSTWCTIKSNTILSATENAVSVTTKSNNAKILNNKITGNTIKDSLNRGIFIYGAKKATITGNTIKSCKAKQEININAATECIVKNNTIK